MARKVRKQKPKDNSRIRGLKMATLEEGVGSEVVRQIISYNPVLGTLTWLPRPASLFKSEQFQKSWNRKNAGQPAVSLAFNGYHVVSVKGHQAGAHRVAWFLHYGEWPRGQIDHINHVRTDNRIENLRQVTSGSNHRNRSRSDKNTSGFTGVSWAPHAGKWRAQIGRNRQHLGYFDCVNDAARARREAEARLGYHPNHGLELHQILSKREGRA